MVSSLSSVGQVSSGNLELSRRGALDGAGRHGGGRGCRHAGGGGSFGGTGAENHYPPSLELEPVHIEINIIIDLELQTAQLDVVTSVVCNRPGARRLTLDGIAFKALRVGDPATGAALASTYDGRKIEVLWDKPFAAGETRQVRTSYRVEQPAAGIYFMKPTPEYPAKALYAATDHETELARYWLACVDLPNVRTTLAFHITAAEGLTLLANGRLVAEEVHPGGTKTAHWQLDQRCPSYLVCFAVGDFVRYDDGEFEGMPLAYFACKDFAAEDLSRSFGRTRPMLQWMTKKLGVPFPFPKYFQFALPGFDGAMENISLVSWSDRFLCDERRAPEGEWLMDQVNVHEMAHSYFGDLVVCRDFAHAWLKESWATYIETCWLEDSKGGDEQCYDLYCNARAYFEEADEHYSRPLVTRKFTSSRQMYDRHLYPGGACRLHTLRKELGDEVFWRAVGDYLRTYAGKVVETADFRRKLEEHSGRSLQKLFDQWVYTAAYPNLLVEFAYDPEKKLGTFEVTQKQADAKTGVPPFELCTDLGWVIDGELHLRSVRLTQARHSFQIPMAKDPAQVRFDPLWKVLHRLEFDPGAPRLRHQLTDAKDVAGRIHAAQRLCETGNRDDLRAVARAYGLEPFWGVRRELVSALAKTQSEEALGALAQIVRSEAHPLVLDHVFAAAGELRDARIAAALTERLAAGPLPPWARSAIYLALGRQSAAAPVEVLRAGAAQAESRYGVEQAAALTALGRTRRAELLPELLAASAYGRVPFRARYGAVHGLAALAPHLARGQQQVVEERLADLLRDPDHDVRRSAARGFHGSWAKSAGAALEAYRTRLPLQEQVGVDELLADLKLGEASAAKQVEKQLEELNARYRKLLDRVQDLEDKGSDQAGKV